VNKILGIQEIGNSHRKEVKWSLRMITVDYGATGPSWGKLEGSRKDVEQGERN
jgi:hypothetical protein